MTDRPTPAAEKAGLDPKAWEAAEKAADAELWDRTKEDSTAFERALEVGLRTYLEATPSTPSTHYRQAWEAGRDAAAAIVGADLRSDGTKSAGYVPNWQRHAYRLAEKVRALTPPDALSPWQPIETAPKDGTELLLVDVSAAQRNHHYAVGFFGKIRGEDLLWDWSWGGQPTHWMPLPPPPATEQKGTR